MEKLEEDLRKATKDLESERQLCEQLRRQNTLSLERVEAFKKEIKALQSNPTNRAMEEELASTKARNQRLEEALSTRGQKTIAYITGKHKLVDRMHAIERTRLAKQIAAHEQEAEVAVRKMRTMEEANG